MYLDDNTQYQIDVNWLCNNNLHHWSGWICHAGLDRIAIDPQGLVFGGECQNDLLGHIDGDWSLMNQPTQCKLDHCTGCTDDLLVSKRSVV